MSIQAGLAAGELGGGRAPHHRVLLWGDPKACGGVTQDHCPHRVCSCEIIPPCLPLLSCFSPLDPILHLAAPAWLSHSVSVTSHCLLCLLQWCLSLGLAPFPWLSIPGELQVRSVELSTPARQPKLARLAGGRTAPTCLDKGVWSHQQSPTGPVPRKGTAAWRSPSCPPCSGRLWAGPVICATGTGVDVSQQFPWEQPATGSAW